MSRLSEIETFVSIARSGSISAAARQLGIAKSAVSRRLSELEARLGTQLVVRSTRHSNLTDEGTGFLARAEAALDALNEAESAVRDARQTLSGTLRIAAPVSYGLTKLRQVFACYLHDHPDVTLQVDFSDRQVDLVREGFDLAIRIGDLADSSLIARKITSVRNCAVASPAFWDAHGRPATPEDLNQLPLLRYETDTPRPDIHFEGPDGRRGTISPPCRVRASNGEFLAQMAAEGLGFMVEPDFVIDDHLANGTLERIMTEYTWSGLDLHVVYPGTRLLTRRTEVFIETLSVALRSAS